MLCTETNYIKLVELTWLQVNFVEQTLDSKFYGLHEL